MHCCVQLLMRTRVGCGVVSVLSVLQLSCTARSVLWILVISGHGASRTDASTDRLTDDIIELLLLGRCNIIIVVHLVVFFVLFVVIVCLTITNLQCIIILLVMPPSLVVSNSNLTDVQNSFMTGWRTRFLIKPI